MSQNKLQTLRIATAAALLLPLTSLHAAQFAVPELSPMPFRAGVPVTVSTTLPQSFTNLSAYVSVRTAENTTLVDQVVPLGSVQPGKRKLKDFTVPVSPQAKGVVVFVALLQGDEKFVGEPGLTTYNFLGRCPRAEKAAVGTACIYATAKYWAKTTKAK